MRPVASPSESSPRTSGESAYVSTVGARRLRPLRPAVAVVVLVGAVCAPLAAQRLVRLEKTTVVETAKLRGGLTISHTADWSVMPTRFANMKELVRGRFDGQAPTDPNSRIKITYENRRSRAEAVGRLNDISFGVGANPDAFLSIAGWPAIQHHRVDRREQRNRDRKYKSETIIRVTTAIAVDDTLIRIEAILPPDAKADMIDESKQIARSIGVTLVGDENQTKQELETLRRQAEQRKAAAPVPVAPANAPAPQGAAAASDTGASANQRIFNGGNGELEIAVSPDGQFVVIGRQSRWVTSTDGGQTYGPVGFIPFTGGDPSLAYGVSGSFYYAGILGGCRAADAAGPEGYTCTGMARSDDNGATFPFVTPAVFCPNRATAPTPSYPGECFPDQEHIAADRWNAAVGGDQVYSTWRNFDATDQDPALVCTQDSGQTWTAPIDVGTGSFPRINVGQDGFVYVVYRSGGNYMLNKFSSCATGLVVQAGFPVVVAARNPVTCPFAGHDRCDQNPSSQMIAADDTNANHLYFVSGQSTGASNDDIIVRDSLDGGLTWPAARNVRVNAAATGARIMPWVCTTGGTAFLTWYDRRNATAGNNDLTEYWGGSASVDGGNNLVSGGDFVISEVQDAWCASGWPCGGGRSTGDSESCSVQPQLSGTCCDNTQTGCPGSGVRCDFSQGALADNLCPAGETCNTGGGCPKYGDYNGNACMLGRLYTGWASATPPPGVASSGSIDILTEARTMQNVAPTASCQNFEDVADGDCCITVDVADIDNGSMDPNGVGDIDTLCITAVDGADVGCQQSVEVCDDGTFNTHTVTLTITDLQNASSSCDAEVDVIDNTDPTTTCDATAGLADENCEYDMPFTATIDDNCCVNPDDVTVNVSLTTANATLGTPSISKVSSNNGTRVEVSGTVLVSDLTSCPATVEVTVDAVDCWGNSTTQCVVTADVNEEIPPVIVCPDPITLARGDKLCNTDVQDWLDSTTATDNCDTDVDIVDDSVSNGFDCGFPFDSTTTVTWTATDDCGNTSECSSTITIEPAHRIAATNKGSVLIYSNVEIKWDADGNVIQDTVLEITNDYAQNVYVQFYFVNGDDPRDGVYAGDPPQLIAEGEPGWNNVDCQALLTMNQPLYWSVSSGSPLGCQPFGVLDPGDPPGRPDPESATGGRVLRGYVYAWAVDNAGEEIRWNHLSGSATVVHYGDASAWEYNAYAASTTCLAQGERPLDCSEFDANGTCCVADVVPGQLDLDAFQYDIAFDRLLLSFVASGSSVLSGGDASVQVDTDLTLHPVSQDLRSESAGPVTTRAQFDIWNMNERRFSGTQRCLTCWDQTLLSRFDAPNHFILQNLQSDYGKARIDGGGNDAACDGFSQSAALLGVTSKLLSFNGVSINLAASGRTLVGQGMESATIRNDIIRPPGELIGVLITPDAQPIDLGLRSTIQTDKVAAPREGGR
jgi:hypothetical protein